MLIVGVTGGIGGGKSMVCKIFSSLGYPVFYADEVAKSILHKTEVTQKVVQLFGSEILNSDNNIDRSKLAKIVFSSPKKLSLLNKVIHKGVATAFQVWLSQQSSNLIFKEAAILFESGSNVACDFVVNVACPVDVRIKRVLKRDDRTEAQIHAIIKRQWSEEQRFKISDFTLHNNNQKVLPQVLLLQEILLKRVDDVEIMT